MQLKLLCAITTICAAYFSGMAAKYTQDGIIYSVNSSNHHASVQGPTDISIKKVNIPNTITYKNEKYTVTSIANKAFNGCSSLTSVTMGNGIETIGTDAFSESGLKSITLSTKLRVIGENAFYNTDLTSLTLPNSVTTVRRRAFCYNSKLKSVNLGTGVKDLGEFAFTECVALTSAALSDGMTTMGKDAFKGCTALSNANIPASLTAIPSGAFEGCPLKYVNIPAKATSIGEGAFFNCQASAIIIPGSVKSIGPWAFERSTVQSLTLGEGITTIGEMAFSECIQLMGVSLPSTATSIGQRAFQKCYGLKTVNFPATMKTIPSYLFYECGLENLNINEGVENIGACAFRNNVKLIGVSMPSTMRTIGEYAFNGCDDISDVVFNEGLVSIGSMAFTSSALYKFTLPSTLKTLAPQALFGLYPRQITCNAIVPPTCGEDAISEYAAGWCHLWVPAASVKAYESAPVWKNFAYIHAIGDPSDIKEVAGDEADQSIRYFDLKGLPVDSPESGQTLIKITLHPDGKSSSSKIIY